MSPLPGQSIAVWFSCGAASAAAAYKTIEKYKNTNRIYIVNNPVAEEDPDNQRFLKDVEKWLNVDIHKAINPKYPNASAVEVWEDRQYISGPAGAPCTLELKKEARRHWEKKYKPDWHVLGFTFEEVDRYERFVLSERANVLPVLIEDKITKEQCYQICIDAGLKLPDIYYRGYPNANCIGCVKASSATYWNLVRRDSPEVFKHRAEQSRRIGAKLAWYKGKRIFLDELPEDAQGRPLKTMQIDCGIFCEEIKEAL